MKLTRKRVVAAVSGVVFLHVLGLYLFLYRPLSQSLSKGRLEYQAIEARLLQARQALVSLEAAGARKYLIWAEDVSVAIDELTRSAKARGIEFISMRPKKIEDVKGDGYRILPIALELRATYKELAVFLGSLSDLSESLVTVGSFKILPPQADASDLKIKLVLYMHLEGSEGD